MFRGDCYISTYTRRMQWNFIDPDLPTNKRIVDPYTWAKHFRISRKASTIVKNSDITGTSTLVYNKLLPLFTYKNTTILDYTGQNDADDIAIPTGLIEPDGKRFKKYSERNGLFGAEKINRPDINAVPLGH
ncbi:MAG: hypothetical protein ACOH2V_00035 [Candidatus Saccharimonadaceae bacterium]